MHTKIPVIHSSSNTTGKCCTRWYDDHTGAYNQMVPA